MEITLDLHTTAYYTSIILTTTGTLLALLATWNRQFWKSDTGIKLLLTNLILAITSIIITAATKWLS